MTRGTRVTAAGAAAEAAGRAEARAARAPASCSQGAGGRGLAGGFDDERARRRRSDSEFLSLAPRALEVKVESSVLTLMPRSN